VVLAGKRKFRQHVGVCCVCTVVEGRHCENGAREDGLLGYM